MPNADADAGYMTQQAETPRVYHRPLDNHIYVRNTCPTLHLSKITTLIVSLFMGLLC